MKKKAKATVPNVRDTDVQFGTLVRDVTATVVAEQGMVVLKVEGDPNPYFLPAGVVLSAETYGTQVEITVREVTHEVVLELGEDDIYERDLEEDNRLMPVSSASEVKQLLEECKIRQITKDAKAFSTCIAGIALAIVGAVLYRRGFQYPMVALLAVPAGVLTALLFGVRPCIRLVRSLNTHIISDCANNYIDVETGKTNMNGGMMLPLVK